MTIEVTLQVTPLDFDDPAVQAKIAELDQYDWANINGVSTMTVFSDGDPISDAVQAIRCALSHGIEVVRVYDEHVNHGEIARRIGNFSREAVRKWSQDPTFPLLVDAGGGERPSPQYRWADVVRWLFDAKGIDMDEELPDEKTVAAINAHIHGLFHDGANVAIYPVHVTTQFRRATVVRPDFFFSETEDGWIIDVPYLVGATDSGR